MSTKLVLIPDFTELNAVILITIWQSSIRINIKYLQIQKNFEYSFIFCNLYDYYRQIFFDVSKC